MSDLEELDLEGPLLTGRVVVEASAGTGKTYSLSALVVRAVIEQLIEAGVAATNIVVWDRDLLTLRLAGFPALACIRSNIMAL